MGGRRRNVWGGGTGVWLHLEEIVGFVFDDVDVVFLRYLIKCLSALSALRCSCRVLASRDGIEEVGFWGAVTVAG